MFRRIIRKCNALCPVCEKLGQIANLSERFLIENNMCQYNGCYTNFDKKLFYSCFDIETTSTIKTNTETSVVKSMIMERDK
jgi:hypothetical protein